MGSEMCIRDRGSSEEWQADWHDARPFRPHLTARPVIRVARVPVLSHLSLDELGPSDRGGMAVLLEVSCAFALIPHIGLGAGFLVPWARYPRPVVVLQRPAR